MLPYLLAVLGGYLIGDSMDEKFADGGDIIDSEVLDQVSDYITHKFDTTDFEVSIDNNVSPAKLKITYTGYDNAELDFLNAVNDDLFSGQGDKNYNTIEGDLPSYFSNYMKEGGKTYTFQEKVDVISKRLIGTKVPERLKKDYGEKYSKEEAIMAAKRIVGSQKSKYDKKKQLSMFSKGGLVEAKTQLMYALEKLSPTQKSIYQKELKKLEDVDLDIDDQMLSDYVNGWYGEEIVNSTDFTGPQAFNVGFKIMALDTAQKHPEFWEEVMMMADGGMAKGGYKVFNYTDNIYASPEVFKTKKEANKFIDSFRKRFENQGYYRTANMDKISVEHIDLEIIPSNFSPFSGEYFADGGGIKVNK